VDGGDGIVNEALQPPVGGITPLAVWPGGTANVLAKELALPRDLERAWRTGSPPAPAVCRAAAPVPAISSRWPG
jgi:diacylglycerol kinase family enzyme